jgi:hypothetical protein
MNPTRTQAIKNFLVAQATSVYPQIADLADLYYEGMEVQVNVDQDGGERISGEFHGRKWLGWTDHVQIWKPIRIPQNANTVPTYTDKEMTFDLEAHAQGIGMTGWDWYHRVSKWVGFDIDSITNHKEGLTEEELDSVIKAVCDLPFVTVRKSTSGRGIHLYVSLNSVQTMNHNEHAALARAILSKMSSLTGFDFNTKVDVCGSNMWVWHRKMQGTDGLTIIKQGGPLEDIPPNWKDHITVVSRKRHKIITKGSNISESNEMEELANNRIYAPLDETHLNIIKALEDIGGSTWDSDHSMLTTHTAALAAVHDQLNLRGIFKTVAQGTNIGADWNCLAGNTEVITKQGVFTLQKLAEIGHAELYVKTPFGFEWLDCPIKSFGRQNTVTIHFGDGSHVDATLNHEWLYIDQQTKQCDIFLNKMYTSELHVDKTQLPLAPFILPEIDYEGYAHGFVYGDGNIVKGKKDRNSWTKVGQDHCEATLFKHDNDLINILKQFGSVQQHTVNGEILPRIIYLPPHWKQLPQKPTKEYAFGFILGLHAADGNISKTQVSIFQSDYYALLEIWKLAIFVGLRCRKPIKYGKPNAPGRFANAKQCYKLVIEAYNLTPDHFIRQDHKNEFIARSKCTCRTISAISSNLVEQEVFCAVVPKWHNFTLANGIITANCFCFPSANGSWIVRRFTKHCQETATWDLDSAGWTRCYYNRDATLAIACRSFGGVERERGGFLFREASVALEALQLLGAYIVVPPSLLDRETILKERQDTRVTIKIKRDPKDDGSIMVTWEPNKDGYWTLIANAPHKAADDTELANYDSLTRHLITSDGNDHGWVINIDNKWISEPLIHVRLTLTAMGLNRFEIDNIIGSAIKSCWTLVNLPFETEYPGNRRWNRDAAQLRHFPREDVDDLHYPHWTMILQHCGANIDGAVQANPWCKANGIETGADYLKCWIASLFQEPEQPLPYLFFYGEQNCGKSIIWEALNLLMTKGVMDAGSALKNDSDFNAELEGTILCIIEEINLRRNLDAYAKIKQWVTAIMMSIHRKQKTPYMTRNLTHWMHFANDQDACPVFPGDTRVVVIQVPPLNPLHLIPKKQLLEELEKEASDFITEILHLELPPSNDRLNIPPIMTDAKADLQQSNETELQTFLREQCFYVEGVSISVEAFCEEFFKTLDAMQVSKWSKIKVGKEMPKEKFPKGRRKDGKWYFGNISFVNGEPIGPKITKDPNTDYLIGFV